jgi:tetratricopeptide (TPR) repeat protein
VYNTGSTVDVFIGVANPCKVWIYMADISRKSETDIIEVTNLANLHQIRMMYNHGDWKEAGEKLAELMDHITDCSDYQGAQVLLGWIEWKRKNKDDALNLWGEAYNNECTKELDRLSAMCGMAIYYSEGDAMNKQIAREIIDAIMVVLEDMEEPSLDLSVRLNSLGIALANISEYVKAEMVLRQAIGINKAIELSDDHRLREEATLQQAKNWYNLCTLVLMKQGKRESDELALTEILCNVVHRYESVGAETDLAAAYHRISELHLKRLPSSVEKLTEKDKKNLQAAYDFEKMSTGIWNKHKGDDPKRLIQAEDNLKGIREIAEIAGPIELETASGQMKKPRDGKSVSNKAGDGESEKSDEPSFLVVRSQTKALTPIRPGL